MKGNVFSESWYKVADIRVGLPNTVDVQKQYYRGSLWYVLRDSFNNSFFRVGPEAYHFIALLTPEKTVEEVWEACLERHQEKAPTQEEVIGLLAQLHANNLLYFRNAPQNEFVFERAGEKRKKELKRKFLSIIAIKIPLWNPDRWLEGIKPFIRLLFGWPGACIWAAVVFLGAKAFVDHFGEVYDKTQSILSQSNIVFFYLALALLKLFHECGHAMMTKRFGGQVPTLGVMFLVFTPLPYMDATSSWFFQNRWRRIGVGAAGMMVDFFFAALAALVWSSTGDGFLHSLAFNMMIIGSITSLAFNGNPLIRFDAYYILSDWFEIPNLYQRSGRQWVYWIEKHLFGVDNAVSPAYSRREAVWLGLYGAASMVYRVLLTLAIVLFVADQVLFLGLLLAVISLGVGLVMPLKRFASYLASSQKLIRKRKRAVAISVGAAAVLLVFVGWFPFPNAIRAPGVVESKAYAKVYAATEGVLAKVHVESGRPVSKGELIAQLANPELDLDIRAVMAGLTQVRALRQKAVHTATADLKPLAEREKVLHEQLAVLEQRRRDLAVTAPVSGVFVSPELATFAGRWLKRQTQIGALIGEGDYRFCAIVSQEQAFDLFREKGFFNQVKLYGRSGEILHLDRIVVIPYQREDLPSAALGWLGGGDISVSTTEKSGKRVMEPFFEINGRIVAPPGTDPLLLHGRSGVLRLVLQPEPLAVQGFKVVKQTIQKRYKI
jgi:putative peptide zinc metalloprotease protein